MEPSFICFTMQSKAKAPTLLESSEMEYRRQLINIVLQNLTIKDKQLRWEYKKPFEILFRTAKTSNWLAIMFRVKPILMSSPQALGYAS